MRGRGAASREAHRGVAVLRGASTSMCTLASDRQEKKRNTNQRTNYKHGGSGGSDVGGGGAGFFVVVVRGGSMVVVVCGRESAKLLPLPFWLKLLRFRFMLSLPFAQVALASLAHAHWFGVNRFDAVSNEHVCGLFGGVCGSPLAA